MAGKLDGNAIVSGSITAEQLAPGAGGGPKITSIDYPGNTTAVLPTGGETVTLVGTGFDANVQVYLNTTVAHSVSFANANYVSFTTPALSVGQYILYAINGDGGSCLVPNFEVSGSPTWVTTSPLTGFGTTTAVNIQLSATSDSNVTYSLDTDSSLPDGLTLSSSGLISGTLSSPPMVNTTYNFTVVATDEEFQESSRAFSVTAFASASFDISPAVSGITTWNTAVNGPLVLETEGVWTITSSANMNANIVMWGAGGGGAGSGYANVALTSNVTLYAGDLFNPGLNTDPYFSNCGIGGNGSSTVGTSGKFVIINAELY